MHRQANFILHMSTLLSATHISCMHHKLYQFQWQLQIRGSMHNLNMKLPWHDTITIINYIQRHLRQHTIHSTHNQQPGNHLVLTLAPQCLASSVQLQMTPCQIDLDHRWNTTSKTKLEGMVGGISHVPNLLTCLVRNRSVAALDI